ncbi:hypothetical protein OPQ81_008181 [Rhizoctonia solani]|nr:hypothetical protein OPQ81_008181 [Rhizoctonia solani]
MLFRSYGPGSQSDHSHLSVDDALPLLSHACKTGFGDVTALEFDIKASQGPLAYSAVVTITGPDEIGIEFPDSGRHATQLQAKMHAAYKAILGGAIGYIIQSARPATPEFNEPAVHVPTSPKRDLNCVPQAAPPHAANGAITGIKKGKKARGTKPKATPDALNLINTFLQRIYRDRKTPMPKSSQEWEVVFLGGGVTARLTIRLPSGTSRSYGSLAGRSLGPGKDVKIYPSATAAKRGVANDALRAGVLEFIEFDKPSGTSLAQPPPPPQPPNATATNVRAHDSLSSYIAYDPSKPAHATGANSIPISGIVSSSTNELPGPSFSTPISDENTPIGDVGPVPPLEQVIDPIETTSSRNAPPHLNRSLSPVEEMEAVDELLGPASLSNSESSEQEDEEEVVELNSSEYGNDRALSEGCSEPMELDSEIDAAPKEVTVTHPENRLSQPRDEPEPIDEPPNKKQRTEPPKSPIQEVNQESELEEPKVMVGTSYSGILSEFCVERGLAQPQVTYQRSFEYPRAEGPVKYNVSIILGGSRFELSKQYESIQSAEEKLSKRILRQFGVRAKKV